MIDRDPRAAAAETYDLVVVGGGVYGVMATLEAARRGLRAVLLERADFGGETTWNHLRIAHGGLRYLQSLDLRRFHDSVAERRWFLQHFPDLVVPLPCLLPLYGRGFRRPGVLRAALALNDWLSRGRNRGVREDRALPEGRIVGPEETRELLPGVRQEELRGAAMWWDASVESSVRLLMEALRWAVAAGARVLNYVEVESLLTTGRAVAGARGRDLEADVEYDFRAPIVLNAAGPWSGHLAARLVAQASGEAMGDLLDTLFRPSLAFNVLFDRPPVSPMCVGVEPPGEGAPTYFLREWRGRLLAGTVHVPRLEVNEPRATDDEVRRFVERLWAALPGLELTTEEVIHVFAGYLPARETGATELSGSPVILDHAEHGGPTGLISLSGVKFTTARRVVERALRTAFPVLPKPGRSRPPGRRDAPRMWHLEEVRERVDADPDSVRRYARRLCAEEAVVRLEDLLRRRTDWWLDRRAAALGEAAFRSLEEGERPAVGTPPPGEA